MRYEFWSWYSAKGSGGRLSFEGGRSLALSTAECDAILSRHWDLDGAVADVLAARSKPEDR